MNKKDVQIIKDGKFHLALIIGMYLVIDIILLFCLCILELKGMAHKSVLMISLILEFISMLIVSLKGNVRSGIIYYILLLVSPVFLGLLAMSMSFITDNMPFTPTVLVLFRFGYDLNGAVLNNIMRILIAFRVPALFALLICLIVHVLTVGKNGKKAPAKK